ncbi:MAG: PAS domain-containing protein [Syntrophobacteraceae bacterium]
METTKAVTSVSTASKVSPGIQSRIVVLILVMLIPILGIQALAYYYNYHMRKTEELKANLEVARAMGKAFDALVQDVLRQELSIGLALTSTVTLSDEDRTRILNGSRAGNPAIWELFWAWTDGVVTAATGPQFIGMKLDGRPYFQEILSGKDWVVSDLLLSKTTMRPSFTIARGIRNEIGQLLGIIIAAILPDQLDSALALYRPGDAGVSLVDNKGMLVYRFPKAEYTWEQRNLLKYYPEIAQALNGRDVAATVTSERTGLVRLVGFTPVASIGWVSVAARGMDEAMEPVTSALLWQAGCFLFAALFSVLLALWISRTIAGPMEKLYAHTLSLGRGHWGQRIEVLGPKETQALAEALNWMSDERKRAEEALRQSREDLDRAQAVGQIGWWRLDTRRNVLTWSDENHRIFGVSKGTPLTYESFLAIVHPDDRQLVDTQWRAGLRGEPYDIEHRIIADGRVKWVREKAYLELDSEGNLLGGFGVTQDITERKVAEEGLRESEEKLSLALRSAEMGVWRLDLRDGRRYFDGQVCNCLGIDPARFNGTAEEFYAVVHPDDHDTLKAALNRTIESGAPYEVEYRALWSDGNIRHVSTRGRLARNTAGQPQQVDGLLWDITKFKRAKEEIEKSLHEKEVLLKEIHHRVKNNMQVISSLVALQAEYLPDQSVRAVLKDVTHRVRSMALVHEKLYQSTDLARIEFAEYVRSLLGYLWRAHATESSHIRLILDLEPITLSVDAAVPCGLILNELVSNALKHAFDAGNEGEVAVSLQSSAQDQIRLCVRDNGRGLPAGFDWKASPSLGLRLIGLLAGQLGAVVEVSGDGGTEIAVAFKARNRECPDQS